MALMLQDSDDSFRNASEVFLGVLTISKLLENAGHAFFDVHERPIIALKECQSKKKHKKVDKDSEESENTAWAKKKKTKTKENQLKIQSVIDGVNLYEALHIDESASQAEIRNAYRKLALKLHPDKQEKKNEVEDKTVAEPVDEGHREFLIVQEAFEILSDEEKRRKYDSSLPFDEAMPSQKEISSKDFYECFGPVFLRNSRWSARKPCLLLGDASTTLEDVHKFYDFWWEFDSWRDFSQHDEYDLIEAQCREERRWMEKQNSKIRKVYEKDEKKRIDKLTNAAFAKDPRIRAEKEEKANKRAREAEAKKQKLEAERQAALAEAEVIRKKEEEERQQKQAIEEKERAARQAEKEELRLLRQDVRVHRSTYCEDSVSLVDTQDLCIFLDKAQLVSIIDQIEAAIHAGSDINKDVEKLFCDAIESMKRSKDDAKAAKKAQMQNLANDTPRKEQKAEVPWSQEEMTKLAKALQKFPGGVARRWQVISDFIGTRTPDEVVRKSQELAQGQSLKSMGSTLNQTAFDTFKKDHKNTAPPAKTEVEPDLRLDPPNSDMGKGGWTAEQQKALELALSKHDASMPPNERWTAIAKDVSGKTKKECVERFKEIRKAIITTRQKVPVS
eukprot:Platyproteum_vivax@DN6723_c0_g1_i2.p1